MNLQTKEDEVQSEDLIFSGIRNLGIIIFSYQRFGHSLWSSCRKQLHPLTMTRQSFFPSNALSSIKWNNHKICCFLCFLCFYTENTETKEKSGEQKTSQTTNPKSNISKNHLLCAWSADVEQLLPTNLDSTSQREIFNLSSGITIFDNFNLQEPLIFFLTYFYISSGLLGCIMQNIVG